MTDDTTLDPLAILASLGINDITQTERITVGSDTAIWRVIWQAQPYALRVFRPEQAAMCEREIAAMQTAGAGGIPVPIVIRQGIWQQRPVLLLTWIAGQTLSDQLRANVSRGWGLGHAFGQMQAIIHQLPISADADADTWIEWAGDEPELKTRLYELKSRRAALLHLDYHPLNVMADGMRISGVLDWANAQIGDPRADFARTYTILRVEPYSPRRDSLSMMVLRRLLERAWRSGYLYAGGKLDDMALFYAWAGAAMIRDLSFKIGRPGHWLEDQHLDGVRRWRDHWKRQAGITVESGK